MIYGMERFFELPALEELQICGFKDSCRGGQKAVRTENSNTGLILDLQPIDNWLCFQICKVSATVYLMILFFY